MQAMDPMRLDAFQGLWRLSRKVEDVRLGRAGSLEGEARLEPDPGGLAYREEGLLDIGGARYPASRRYLWRDGGAGTIEVLFEDGRLFHRFYADEKRPAAVHQCGQDQYRVRYDFTRWPRWRAEWWVRGPSKDYAIVSAYRPAGQAGESPA